MFGRPPDTAMEVYNDFNPTQGQTIYNPQDSISSRSRKISAGIPSARICPLCQEDDTITYILSERQIMRSNELGVR